MWCKVAVQYVHFLVSDEVRARGREQRLTRKFEKYSKDEMVHIRSIHVSIRINKPTSNLRP